MQECIDAGATFMDNAWEYNDGESERRMGKALAQDGYREKAFLMTKDCAHDRKANHSMWKLEESLTPVCRPIISISGSCTRWSGKTMSTGSSRRAGRPRRC